MGPATSSFPKPGATNSSCDCRREGKGEGYAMQPIPISDPIPGK
jgi:hypothetical protein